MNLYGLIGYPLSHSFSQKYFTEKFAREGIADSAYELFEMPDVSALPELLAAQPALRGLNVTIPHKQQVMPLLDALDDSARKVGAVNVIKLEASGKKTGYNSDYYGFRQSLEAWLIGEDLASLRALVLGNGGACKAVKAALADLHLPFRVVSRQATGEGPDATISYEQLTPELIGQHRLIVQTTPLGTYPQTDACPPIPYEALTAGHFLYDLVYNPAETLFMQKGKAQGAKVHNGLPMLYLQAEKAWEIWNR